MKFLELHSHLNQNLFTTLDIKKGFPLESKQQLNVQITRFVKKGLIFQIKKSLYCFNLNIDEFVLANRLYPKSYISLESALNYYGIIPDIPQAVTSINLTTTKQFNNQFGKFYYAKIKPLLFWGYLEIQAANKTEWFKIANKEKALLDYLYVRKITSLEELRLDLKILNKNILKEYSRCYPRWIQKINYD